MSYSPKQLERLAENYHRFAPHLDHVVELFILNLREELDESEDWKPPTDADLERISEVISKIGLSFENPDQLVDVNDYPTSILDDRSYIAVRESLLSAIAWISDYTWTDQLRSDWALTFDLVPNMLLTGSMGKQMPLAA